MLYEKNDKDTGQLMQYSSEEAKRLRKIIDSSVDIICCINKNGIFTEVSAASYCMLGYKPQEMMGQQFINYVADEDREKCMHTFERILAGEQMSNFQSRYKRKNGELLPISWSAKWDNEEQLVFCVGRDITTLKETEKRLKEQDRRLQKAHQIANLANWEYNIKTKKFWHSQILRNILGLSPNHPPLDSLQSLLTYVHPDDKPILQKIIKNIEYENQPVYELRFIRPDKKIIYVQHAADITNENDQPLLINGIIQDITKRKEAELNLALSERRFRSLVQNGFDMFVIIDLNGNYLYASDSIYHILGHKPTDLIGTNTFDLVHPEDREKTAAALNRLYTEKHVDDAEPFRFLDNNGHWRWIEAKGANMLDDEAVKGVVVNCRDITDRKQLTDKFNEEREEQRKKINKAIIKAQEMERKQLGLELHDNVNQVLTTIKLYTELSLTNNTDSHALLEKSIVYLNNCINEIRSISKRLSAPTLGKMSFSDSVKELVSSLNLTEKLNITLSLDGINNKFDQETYLGIYRIIQEHLTNILKHADASHVSLQITASEKEMTVLINDNGKGFIVNTKRKGVGISNMYSRAESLNAKLTIDSAQGQGAQLKLVIPIK